ncbi:uncharacterized protein LOC111333923 [Stylophora pistillata]|uniref:uncharacterized protein LOC111333923 n=1 Tax=Stylophora pistillata TaxID=50429 RepID=UPI000C043003|nr:uncharacterized protein LOC111333923 [Stylophora pistillata]
MEWTWSRATWISEKIFTALGWLSDLTWRGATWFGPLAWNCIQWLAELLWDLIQWLADATIYGGYSFIGMVWNTAVNLVQIMFDAVMWIVKPFVPVICYITDATVEFYTDYLHEHVKIVLSRFVFLSWHDGVYTFFAGLVVDFGFLIAGFLSYWLLLRIVNFTGRKWQEYKDRRAAANLPPKPPQKRIWQRRQRKKKKTHNDW